MFERAGEIGLGVFGFRADRDAFLLRKRIGDLGDVAGEAVVAQVVTFLEAAQEGRIGRVTLFYLRSFDIRFLRGGHGGGEDTLGEIAARRLGGFVDELLRRTIEAVVERLVGFRGRRCDRLDERGEFVAGDFELLHEFVAISRFGSLRGEGKNAGESVAGAFYVIVELAFHLAREVRGEGVGEGFGQGGAFGFDRLEKLWQLRGAPLESGGGVGSGAEGIDLFGQGGVERGGFASDRGEGGAFFQAGHGKEGGAVELLRGRKPLVGEPHRIGVVDDYGDLARDLAFLDKGAHRLHKDEEKNDERGEAQSEEESSTTRGDERLLEAVDPDDGLCRGRAEEGDGNERPRGGEGEESTEELEGEPAGRGGEDEAEDREHDRHPGGTAAPLHRGEPKEGTDEQARPGKKGTERVDEVGAAEVVGVHGANRPAGE